MRVEYLKYYLIICQRRHIEPTWRGLKDWYETCPIDVERK